MVPSSTQATLGVLREKLELLSKALGRTEDEVERLVAAYEARPVPRDVVRKLPSRVVAASELPLAPQRASTPAVEEPLFALPPPRPRVEPVNDEWTRIAFSAGKDFMEELQQTRASLSHVVPGGDFEALFRECMRLAREACLRRRLGAPSSAPNQAELEPGSFGPKLSSAPASPDHEPASFGPKLVEDCTAASAPAPTHEAPASFGPKLAEEGAAPAPPDEAFPSFGPKPATGASRYIPVEVRRAVWERDGGCCSWVGPTGRRCSSTHRLEFDHWDPVALGGEATVDNVRLLCHSHNQHWARVVFGAEHMARYRRSEAPPATCTPTPGL